MNTGSQVRQKVAIELQTQKPIACKSRILTITPLIVLAKMWKHMIHILEHDKLREYYSKIYCCNTAHSEVRSS